MAAADEKKDGENDGGFQCTALTDYFAAATDELDLTAGAVYTIITTSASGWWYAEDEDGDVGWTPSNYLVRLDDDDDDEDYSESETDLDTDDEFGGGDKKKDDEKENPANNEKNELKDVKTEPLRSKKSETRRKKHTRFVTMTNDDVENAAKLKESQEKIARQTEQSSRNFEKRIEKEKQDKIKWEAQKEERERKKREQAEKDRIRAKEKKAREEKARLEKEEKERLEAIRRKEMEEKERIEQAKRDEEKRIQEEKERERREKREKKEAKRLEKQKKKAEKVLAQYKKEQQMREQGQSGGGRGGPAQSASSGGGAPVSQSGRFQFQVVVPVTGQYDVAGWDIDQLLKFLAENPSASNQYQLKSVLTNIAKVALSGAREGDHGGGALQEYILTQNGLNLVLNVLRDCKDIAISMACCRVITILCEAQMSVKYPANPSGVYFLTNAIQNSFLNPIFCYTAFNCICNFTHKNPRHRNFILDDPHNREIISCIIEGMLKFRYVEEVSKNFHCERVQISACLALQNLAADVKGQKVIGDAEGIEAIIGGFLAHVENPEVVSATLGALKNLVAYSVNAETFLNEDGLEHIYTLVSNPDVSIPSRIAAVKVLINIAGSPYTAVLLSEKDDCVDLLKTLLANAPYSSDLYPSILYVINMIIVKVNAQSAKKKKSFMEKLKNDGDILDLLSQALDFDWESLTHDEVARTAIAKKRVKARIQKIFKEISTVIDAYVNLKTGDDDMIEDVIASGCLGKLIAPCVDYATPLLVHHTFAAIHGVFDKSVEFQMSLIQDGLVYLLFENEWWDIQGCALTIQAIKLGLVIMIKMCQSYAETRTEWVITDHARQIERVSDFVQSRKRQLSGVTKLLQSRYRTATYVNE